MHDDNHNGNGDNGDKSSVPGDIKPAEKTVHGLSETEERVRGIWKGILELDEISPDDDFFRSGGNSLTAIELLIKIHRAFSITLPPDTIYRYPTIRKQAGVISQKTRMKKPYHTLIIPLRQEGSRPPLFCIHYHGGWIDHYLKILPAIDPSRPVFGIRGEGLEPGEVVPVSVEEVAKGQIEAMKSVQETGPYYLMGFSYGTIIAYEMACQLQEKGERVAFLGLIDQSVPPTEARYVKILVSKLFPGRILGRIPVFIHEKLTTHPDRWYYKWVMGAMSTAFHGVLFRSREKDLPDSIANPRIAAMNDAVDNPTADNRHVLGYFSHFPQETQKRMVAQIKGMDTYVPHTYRGDVVFFSTGPDPVLYPGDATRGWGSRISGRCRVLPLEGNHGSLYDEPYVSVLNDRIRESGINDDTPPAGDPKVP